MDVAECALAERHAVMPPVLGERLALEARDIHADGAFGLARATLEAQVEHVEHAVVGQTGVGEAARHREPERVRPTARGVLLVPRRDIRRAHRPIERFAAGADPAAHLDGPAKAAVLGVVEECRGIGCSVAGAVA